MVKKNEARENRILMEIVVDAYDKEERISGWYYTIAEECVYPFKATCIVKRRTSPLKLKEAVLVKDIAPYEDCLNEICVDIEYGGDILAVPLSQLSCLSDDKNTKQAVGDWHYWVKMGYVF